MPNLKLIGTADGLASACSCSTSPGPTVCLRVLPLDIFVPRCEYVTACELNSGVVTTWCCASMSMSTNFSNSLLESLTSGNDVNVLTELLNGLKRSIASFLRASVRSTTPVVILAFRDLQRIPFHISKFIRNHMYRKMHSLCVT